MVKIERVDNELTKELNFIVSRELKDPRLSANMVSVTAVETSKDLKTAKVFVSIMENNLDKSEDGLSGNSSEKVVKDILNALNGASAFIRTLLFDRLKIRTVPHLTFIKDNSIAHSFKIESILKGLNIDTSKENISEEGDD